MFIVGSTSTRPQPDFDLDAVSFGLKVNHELVNAEGCPCKIFVHEFIRNKSLKRTLRKIIAEVFEMNYHR